MRCVVAMVIIGAGMAVALPAPGGGSIEGHVVHALSGAPLARATVRLSASASSIWLVAESDATGRFEFTGLPPGTYKVIGSRRGFLDHAARRLIALGRGEQVLDAEIRLPPECAIRGRVLDEGGDAVDGARVVVYRQIWRYGGKRWDRVNGLAETNDEGEYRVAGLRPGRYLVQAMDQRPAVDNHYGSPPRAYTVPVYHPSAADQREATPVEVGLGVEARGVDIRLVRVTRVPDVRVRGKVAGVAAGTLVSVVATMDGGFWGGSMTAGPPAYEFELRLQPGQYTLSGSVYSGGPAAYGSTSLAVTGDVDGVALILTPAPEVTGRISVAESDAKVNLKDVRVTLAALSGPPGAYELRSDAAGKIGPFPEMLRRPGHVAIVEVRGIPNDCFIREIRFGDKEISPDDFEIVSSGELQIVLSNTAGKIAGSAVDADGKPFAGATVTLAAGDGKSRAVKQAADEAGNFQFANLRPGTYKLFAWEEVDDDLWPDPEFRKRYEDRATAITVGEGESKNVRLRLIAVEEMK
jgi:hypothetical protein